MSKTDLKFAGDELILSMVSEDSPCMFSIPNTIDECRHMIDDINDGIAECEDMELYAKDKGWEDEVQSWRGMIQKNKAMMHALHNRIKELGRSQKGYATA